MNRLWSLLKLLLAGLLVLLLSAPAWPRFGDQEFQILSRVGLRQFDFVTWWIETVVEKRGDALSNTHRFISDPDRQEIVLQFVAQTGEIRQLEWELNRLYADASIEDPAAATAQLQAEIEGKRAALADLQSLAEPILQEQISEVLLDFGFGSAGEIFPPVSAHVTPLPAILIVSPRDRIDQLESVPLRSGLLPPERAALEGSIYGDLDLSAYVTDIGGLGIYPSMIIETTSLNFLAEVIAHEWAHHWFTLRPMGRNYLSSPEMRTINESAASIVGKEVGAEVIRRYYPEFAPPPTPTPPPNPSPTPVPTVGPTPTPDPTLFDFRREMGITRVRVDELLSAGQIDEAEAFMEERRQLFVARGYNLRVLNQAYFSFHGAYADVGGGAAGRDPVGPLVADVRQAAGSLQNFMQSIAFVTDFAALEAVAVELGVSLESDR